MEHCSRYIAAPPVAECGLVAGLQFAPIESANCICHVCRPRWKDGQEPTTREEIPLVVLQSIGLEPPPAIEELPHPDGCDHMERPLPPFEGCCDQRTWQCGLHGEVRLSFCRGECKDFRRHDAPPDGLP